jgi:hypothetical protein
MKTNITFHEQAIKLLEAIRWNRQRIAQVEEMVNTDIYRWIPKLRNYYQHKLAIYKMVDNRLVERYTKLINKFRFNEL